MPTVEKKYTEDVYKGREDFQGNHDVYEMPEEHKPKRAHGQDIHPKVIMVTLAILTFVSFVAVAVYEILKRSSGYS